MNELIFIIQILLILLFIWGTLKLGQEALVTWVTIQALLANLFVLKQINLWGLEVTASDAFAIGSLLGLSFLQERFGREAASKAIGTCFFSMLFFVGISQLHLLYQPNRYDTTQEAFLTLFTPSPRLLFASMSVFLVVQQLEMRLFTFFKYFLPSLSFAGRTAGVLVITQFLDTGLFSVIGLYGIVASMINVMMMSFAIKLIVIFCFTSGIKWAKI